MANIKVENQERLNSLKKEELKIIVLQIIDESEKKNVDVWNKATLVNKILNSEITDEELEKLFPNIVTDEEENTKEVEKQESEEPSKEVLQNLILDMRKRALENVVVTITCLDEKDISMNKECETFSIENAYFSVGKVVPFNIPVEIPRALVDMIKEIKISKVVTLSEEQQKLQKRYSIVRRVPRYNVAIMDKEALKGY